MEALQARVADLELSQKNLSRQLSEAHDLLKKREQEVALVEQIVSELEFLIGERDGQRDDTDTADLKQFSAAAAAALGKYLSLVPPPEMAAARALIADGKA